MVSSIFSEISVKSVHFFADMLRFCCKKFINWDEISIFVQKFVDLRNLIFKKLVFLDGCFE